MSRRDWREFADSLAVLALLMTCAVIGLIVAGGALW